MPNFNVTSKRTKESMPDVESISKDSEWKPGFGHTPWTALALVIVMLACMAASAGVIAASDTQTVQSWKFTPSVVLALLSSIWNYAVGTLLGICVVVTWWKSALDGTTLESLHFIWNKTGGLNFFSSLLSARARGVVLLAWLVVLAQIANGPLLQRSTRVVSENVVKGDYMTLDITRRLPDGWTGLVQRAPALDIIGSRQGIDAVQGWWENTTILTTQNNTGSECSGSCEGNVQGTGIAYTCTSTVREMDLSNLENDSKSIFSIHTTLDWNATGAPILQLTTVYSAAVDSSCIASIHINSCNIQAAIVEYPIIIQNTTVSLDMDKLASSPIVSIFVSDGDLRTAKLDQGAGPLMGLYNSFGAYFMANATLSITPNSSIYNGGGLIPDLFFVPDEAENATSSIRKCNLVWTDPTSFVFDAMSDWLFRASISSSQPNDTQTFSVQRTSQELIFRSDYEYFGLTLLVMSVTLLGVILQLWGFWRLGRHVTLSPLEVARAFKAPVMEYASHTSTIGGILEAVGKTEVKYDGESLQVEEDETKSLLNLRRRS